MPTSILDRLNPTKKLWRSDEVMDIINTILRDTISRENVVRAIEAIDRFNAGAVDDALRKHTMMVLSDLIAVDKHQDKKIARNWAKMFGLIK